MEKELVQIIGLWYAMLPSDVLDFDDLAKRIAEHINEYTFATVELIEKAGYVKLDSIVIDEEKLPSTRWLCDECYCLYPKERDQTPKKEPHICRATNHVLRHLNEHPHINPTTDCPKILMLNKVKLTKPFKITL